MAAIQFYQLDQSPPCRTVELVATNLNVNFEKKPVNLMAGEHLKPEMLEINPRHVIPFIVDGDLSLTESRAICQYLVNKYGGKDNPLYPEDPVKRAKVDELIFFDATALFPALHTALRPVIFEGKHLDSCHVEAFNRVARSLDQLLASRTEFKYSVSDQLTLADYMLVVSLTTAEAGGFDLKEFKTLTNYLETSKKDIPNFAAINDGPLSNTRKTIATKRASHVSRKR